MLRTSSGEREKLLAGDVDSACSAARLLSATIPGARLARGTRRGRPALVVCTEAGWSVGSGSGTAMSSPCRGARGCAGCHERGWGGCCGGGCCCGCCDGCGGCGCGCGGCHERGCAGGRSGGCGAS